MIGAIDISPALAVLALAMTGGALWRLIKKTRRDDVLELTDEIR